MTENLDQLSTEELHDRALRRAERHFDVRFLWSLLQMIPAAETAGGELDEADFDIQHSRRLISEALDGGSEASEMLRPVFIDYLQKHADA